MSISYLIKSKTLPYPYSKLSIKDWAIYSWLDKSQWYSGKQMRDYQDRKLQEIIKHAYQNIPYYTKVFNERGLKPKDIQTKEDLKKLPFLTKGIIRANWKDLVWDKEKGNVSCSTSGSTGPPLEVRMSRKAMRMYSFSHRRFYEQAGYKIGSRTAYLRTNANAREKEATVSFPTKTELLLNTAFLSRGILQKYTTALKNFNPEFLSCDSLSLNLLIRHLTQENKTKTLSLKAIFSIGMKLIPEIRVQAEQFFGCKVFERYGSSEGVVSAGECCFQEGLHLNFETGMLEIMSNDETSLKGGFVVTGLINRAMPLIRYRIGDEGEECLRRCLCGRSTPLLKNIFGFRKDRIVVPGGASVSGHFLMTKVLKERWICLAQIVQERKDQLIIKIVKEQEPSLEQIQKFLSSIRETLGKNIKIEIDFVDDVEMSEGGKRNFIVSKVPPEIHT